MVKFNSTNLTKNVYSQSEEHSSDSPNFLFDNTDDNKSDSTNDESDDDMRLVDSNNSIRNNCHGKNVI